MYHPKPLSQEILKDNSLKYNPSINYEEGDNIYSEPIQFRRIYSEPIHYRQYLARKFALDFFDNLEIETSLVNIKKRNLKEFCSKSEYFNINFKIEYLKQFKNIIETDHAEAKDVENYLNNGHSDLVFFGNKNTLLLNKYIKAYLEEKKEVNLTMLLFNMNLCNDIPECLKECKINFEIPEIELKYLPNLAIYSKIKNIQYGLIPPPSEEYQEYYYVYTNLPRNLYKNIIIENKLLHYNITDEQFYGHVALNITNLNFCCKHLASNNLDEIIVLKITKDGYFIPILCYKQLLASLYIDYPSIPVCIIVDPFELYDYYIYKKNDINLKETKEFLAPYILLND